MSTFLFTNHFPLHLPPILHQTQYPSDQLLALCFAFMLNTKGCLDKHCLLLWWAGSLFNPLHASLLAASTWRWATTLCKQGRFLGSGSLTGRDLQGLQNGSPKKSLQIFFCGVSNSPLWVFTRTGQLKEMGVLSLLFPRKTKKWKHYLMAASLATSFWWIVTMLFYQINPKGRANAKGNWPNCRDKFCG